jgi:heterodisulfide reductase subunit C
MRKKIMQKVNAYVSRAEQIKEILDKNNEKKENEYEPGSETKYKICKTCGSSWNSCPEDYDDEIEKRLIRLAIEDCLDCEIRNNNSWICE